MTVNSILQKSWSGPYRIPDCRSAPVLHTGKCVHENHSLPSCNIHIRQPSRSPQQTSK